MDTLRYFTENIFDESLVFSFVYKPEISMITLICDYANDVVQAMLNAKKLPLKLNKVLYHRDIRRLDFSGVAKYSRTNITSKQLAKYSDKYSIQKHGRNVTLHDIKIKNNDGIFNITFDFGSFGQCKYSFVEFIVHRKLIYALDEKNKSNEWIYVDAMSKQPVNLYNPFL